MKISFNNKDFLKALTLARKVAPKKSSISALECFYLKTNRNNNSFQLIASNLEITLAKTVNAKFFGNDSDFECIIEFDKIMKAVKQFSESETWLNMGEQVGFIQHFTLENGNRTFKGVANVDENSVRLLSDYFEKEKVYESYILGANLDNMIERINSIKYAIATNDIRPILKGVNFKDNRICAMDGYRCCVSEDKSDNSLCIDGEFTINPSAFLILKGFDEHEFNLYINSKNIEIETDTINVIVKCMNDNYRNYENCFPRDFTAKVKADTKQMISDLKYIHSQYDVKNPEPVVWKDNELSTSTVSAKIELEGKSKEIHTGFNMNYFYDCISNINTEKIEFCYSGKLTPMLVKSVESNACNNLYALVLPVKLKEEK